MLGAREKEGGFSSVKRRFSGSVNYLSGGEVSQPTGFSIPLPGYVWAVFVF